MTEERESAADDDWAPGDGTRIAYGIVIGLLAGLFIGLLTHDIGLWLPMGICFGPVIGAIWNQARRDRAE